MLMRKFLAFAWVGSLAIAAGLVGGCGVAPRSEAPPLQTDPILDGQELMPPDDGADASSAKSFVGQVANTLALLGLVAEGERIIAYVCDGDPGPQSLSQWYEGWLAPDGSFELESSAAYNWGDDWDWNAEWSSVGYAGTALAGRIEGDIVTGWTYDAAGREMAWVAELTEGSGPAGLYVGDDGEVVASIVVLNEHLAQGVTRTRATGVRTTVTAPMRIPADGSFAVTSSGQDLQVRAVVVPISLTDTGIVERSPAPTPPSDSRDSNRVSDPGRTPAPENAIQIKFRDGLMIRMPRGAREPVDLNGRALVSRDARALLAEVGDGMWSRSHLVDERTLDNLRANGERRTRKPLPDLNLYFNLQLPRELDAGEYVQRFRRLAEVEWAWITPDYFLAAVPDFSESQGLNAANKMEPYQRYLDEAPVGVDARYAWLWNADPDYGGTGRGVKVVDIETSFFAGHPDLPEVTLEFPTDTNATISSVNHGTATLGVIGGRNNSLGVKGIAHDAEFYFVPATFGANLALQGAIGLDGAMINSITANALDAGDVIVLEQQLDGPNYVYDPNDPLDQYGLVAVEWYKPNYDAIRTATANGYVVVEAAGNGQQNLDGAEYLNNQDAYHKPFEMSGTTRVNDSGAIIVGAGASGADWSLYGALTPHSRQTFSNYGGRVDLHAWGDSVVTSGIAAHAPDKIIEYPDDGLPENAAHVYHHHFNGTSSATAVMGGAVASFQGFYKAWNAGTPLNGTSMRAILASTGTPQASGNTQQGTPATHKIGPMPNLRAAIDSIVLNTDPGVPQDDELVQTGCELPPMYFADQAGQCTGGASLPMPSWSLPSGGYDAEALEFVRPIYPDPYPASTVIQYTIDGTSPTGPHPCSQNCNYRLWTITDTNNCISMSYFVDDLTAPLICRARLYNSAYCGQPGSFSPTVTDVYVPTGYIKLPEFDRPTTYTSALAIRMRTGYPNTYPDGFAFVAYTLDGTEPVYYENSSDGVSSPTWTNYLDDFGYRIPVFTDNAQQVVTLKARNYLYIAGKAVPGEVAQWNYPRPD